ncbi:MBL fold metallo-hydrolase [Helicobacter ailurogastricus]|uniref:MBL fold metallo-hydrolase n=1 Tax=Helicobacter ailurogastricus TaxID=1578720 RepID=UPI0022C25457|nr:MBL fold metallo-hydrolase [Helicobacter ailurogastricus]GLH58267.1 Lactamase_B domain-containing protein/MBL fold metallo-hydrolase [Helicobacter ailurogastricus]GLH59139.1 Lactamase_B domain-containing protein/MBL fold metallo-hydrolase [Helicobacter ailurogastricus]
MFEIKVQAFGNTQTNCYVLQLAQGDLVIDPGFQASSWVQEQAKNPLAILITHGHYDHIWDAAALKEQWTDVPLYAPKEDIFMLATDCFHLGQPTCKEADIQPIEGHKKSHSFEVEGVKITYWHFPGHTPGCSVIEVGGVFFSGDFIFHRSIGRYDFPYSNPKDMKESLERFYALDRPDCPIYPGHGRATSLKAEQPHMPAWIAHITS